MVIQLDPLNSESQKYREEAYSLRVSLAKSSLTMALKPQISLQLQYSGMQILTRLEILLV